MTRLLTMASLCARISHKPRPVSRSLSPSTLSPSTLSPSGRSSSLLPVSSLDDHEWVPREASVAPPSATRQYAQPLLRAPTKRVESKSDKSQTASPSASSAFRLSATPGFSFAPVSPPVTPAIGAETIIKALQSVSDMGFDSSICKFALVRHSMNVTVAVHSILSGDIYVKGSKADIESQRDWNCMLERLGCRAQVPFVWPFFSVDCVSRLAVVYKTHLLS